MEGIGRTHRMLLAIAALAAVAGFATARGPLAHAAASSPGFGQPTPSGIEGDGFEQDVALDDTNANKHIVYSSAPVGTTTGISNIWRSLDGGQTFKFIPAIISPNTGGHSVTCPAGGGDSELAVDSGGHLYFADLYLGNFSVARSDDKATSWAPTPSCNAVPTDAVVDRQWYATQGDPTSGGALFLTYDRFVQSVSSCPGNTQVGGNALVITRSPALGQAGATAGNVFDPSLVLDCDEGIMGNDAFFDYTGVTPGGGPEVYVVQDNNALNKIEMNRCDVVAQTVTNPVGLTNCVNNVVSSFPTGITGGNFATMSIDTQGNLFTVWEQAPQSGGNVTGNTQLFFATSSDEGNTWSVHQLPTPGLNQDVMAWAASGDPGRIDVAFYGTPAPWVTGDTSGPDSISGFYSLYLAQTLDGGTTWTVTLASEHFIHHGTMQTLIGGQNGDRDVGDFLKVAIGPQGEANISYSDDNNLNQGGLDPQAFFVRQNGGPGVYANRDNGLGPGVVNLPAAPTGPCVSDPSGDATLDAANTVGPSNTNLDILSYCMSLADPTDYQITIHVTDLSSLGPDATAGGSTNIWQVQWHVPSTSDPVGGALFMAYAESVAGGAVTCWVGQASQLNAEITYPGTTQLPAANCIADQSTGTISIKVPTADVTEPNPVSSTLYAVAASTQTMTGDAETPAPQNVPGVGYTGGKLPAVIDAAAAFDLNPSQVNVPELPWAPLAVVTGVLATAVLSGRVVRRRMLALNS